MDIKNRDSIDNKYKWDLSKLFKSNEDWDNTFNDVKKSYKAVSQFKGKLNNQFDILNCYKFQEGVSRKIHNLFTYSKMRLDEDATVDIYQRQLGKMQILISEIEQAFAFIIPEVSKLDEEVLIQFSKNETLSDYSYHFEKLAKNKKHVLSDSEEVLLAGMGVFTDDFKNAFSMFDNSEIRFKNVKNEEGKRVDLSHGSYSVFLNSKDRNVRKAAYKSMFTAYKEMINTISTLYAGQVKLDCYFSKVRKFKSAMDASLQSEDVTVAVYNSLIKSVHSNLDILHRYFDVRAKALGLKKLNMWDLHVPIAKNLDLNFEYQKACDIVIDALKPLGNEYSSLLKRAMTERWIDVYENKGKRSGAYSWGTYDSLPYVLLNHNGTLHDVFTIAHELGHSMHSYYSDHNQPFSKAQYEIFVAEVASTVNEVLLLKYLLKQENISEKPNKNMKIYLLSYYLDMFRTTLFRQTQFAEFEKISHEMHESSKPLTSSELNKAYLKLNKKYYGTNVVSDDLIKYEWARIPHFYNSFYVYKYATGITSAVIIANGILSGDKKFIEGYFKFLSLGGSMSPVDILKVAGVDLEKIETFDVAMNEFKDTLEVLEKELIE